MKKQFQALLLIISILFSIIPQDVASADADLVQSQGTTVSKNETTQKTTFPVHVIHKAGDDKENFVIVIMGDGYTLEEQDKFLQDAAEKARGMLTWSPYILTASIFMRCRRFPTSRESANMGARV
mgnify:CR=1 FL=1